MKVPDIMWEVTTEKKKASKGNREKLKYVDYSKEPQTHHFRNHCWHFKIVKLVFSSSGPAKREECPVWIKNA
jgi:hypothetical protein